MADNPNNNEVLNEPKLLIIIVKTIQSQGVVGESKPIIAEILVCCGKKVKNKSQESTNLHPQDKSGIGKDYITKHIKKIVFKGDWIKFNSPTPTAVTYTQRLAKDEEGQWQTEGKKITEDTIIYIEDASDAFINSDDCKMLLGGDVDTNKTIEGHSVKLKWKKPVVIITTAQTSSANQLIRRLPPLHLDASAQQTKHIIDFNRRKRLSSYNRPENINGYKIRDIVHAFDLLKEYNVYLDDVEDYIKDSMPKSTKMLMRSASNRLFDFIMFSAILHQFQRKKHKDGILANKYDVNVGIIIFNYIYKTDTNEVSNLNQRQRNILARFMKSPYTSFKVSDIQSWEEAEGISDNYLRNKDMPMVMQECPDIEALDGFPLKYKYNPVTEQELEDNDDVFKTII